MDPKLVRFAADLDWVKNQGVIARASTSPNSQATSPPTQTSRRLSRILLMSLPLIKVDGAVKSKGRYPRRAELAAWVGLEAPDEPTARYTIASGPCCSANASGKDSPCC